MATIKNKMDPFFNVIPKPVFVDGKEVPGRVALINGNTQKVLGIVTDKYKPVPNVVVNNLFDKALPFKVQEVQDHMFDGGAVWKRRIILDKDAFHWEILPNDAVGVMLEVFNSYNGKSAYGFRFMSYRWMCSNGMVTGKKNIFSMSLSHMSGAVERIQRGFSGALESFGTNVQLWKDWSKTTFTRKQMKVYLESRPYLTEKAASKVNDKYEFVMNKENLDETAWSAFNAITWMGTHELKTSRQDSSPIFSNSAKVYERLGDDFYNYIPRNGSIALGA